MVHRTSLTLAFLAAPTPSLLRVIAFDGGNYDDPHHRGQERHRPRRPKLFNDSTSGGHLKPKLANKFSLNRPVGVNPVVVIPFEDKAVALLPHNAVDHRPNFRVGVSDNVANPVIRSLTDNHQIATMQARFHTVTRHNHIGCLPAKLERGKEKPDCPHHYQSYGCKKWVGPMPVTFHRANIQKGRDP
jgi:hypothetical protein